MKAPKSVTENNATMSQELLDENLVITRMVYNSVLSNEFVSAKVSDFNERWLAAGGSKASLLVGRKA